MSRKPKYNISPLGSADKNEIFLLEGLPPVTPEIISQLIAKGWQSWKFSDIEKIAPRCGHGHIAAYYSERRDSILIPASVDGVKVTYEMTRSEIRLHTLAYA